MTQLASVRRAKHDMRGRRGEPTWEIVRLFPVQGDWTVEEYLALETNHLVEYAEGVLEFPTMPTMFHQLVVLFLRDMLQAFVHPGNLGTVLIAPFNVKVSKRKFRQPDVLFMRAGHAGRMHNEFWDGADLVMEVVSGSAEDRERDLVTKRAEYARARIPEYWTVDPEGQVVTVLRLKGKTYVRHGAFKPGESATSALLPGFAVTVAEVFAAGRRAGS